MGLELKNISMSFGDFTIQTDLKAGNGELVTLLGPSGCGKTTTLQIIAGILLPETGKIFLQKKDITSLSPWKRGIGIVFQDYALFPHMSVAGNISYGLKLKKLTSSAIKNTVQSYLELVHLSGYENRSIDSLSGGEKQRVALARALAPQPRLLLLDEPLSALDTGMREKLRREIRKIQKHLNITTIYVTHDQEEALTISDKIVIMSNGRIEQSGTPSDIFNRPKTRFAADFLGRSNLIPGRITTISPEKGIEVKTAEVLFKTPYQSSFSVNDQVWIFFRSGNTKILSENKTADNILPGTVEYCEYYGTHTLYGISVNGLTVNAEQTETQNSPDYRHSTNARLSVYIAPEYCHLIKRKTT